MGGAVRVGETRIEVDEYLKAPDRVAQALEQVRQAGGHAQCECVQPARKLVVRRLRARHILAVWPGDGPSHAFACPFYRDELDDAAAPLTEASTEPAEPPPLRVDFLLERRAGTPRRSRADADTSGADEPAREPQGHRLSLPDLLDLLWERSRMNCWASGWTRPWWRVRAEIYRVAQEIRIGERFLDELLYVPPPFRRDDDSKEAIEREWQRFIADLQPRDGAVPRRMVLAEVKSLVKSEFGYKLDLRHAPWPVYLKREQWEQLQASYARALLGLTHPSEPPLRIACLLLVEGATNNKHYLSLCDAAMLMTSEAWIPCHTTAELRLAARLVDQARDFKRPMGANDEALALPDFWLRDVAKDQPTALEVLGVQAVPYRERKMRRVNALRASGHPVWIWDATRDDIPALPPRQ